MPDQTPVQQPAPQVPNTDVPRGGFAKNYPTIIGFGGAGLALLEIFRSDPKDGIGLFAQFGPKYLLWAFIAYIIWDLGKRALKVLNKGADNLGLMARNTGEVATAVNTVANKQDRATEETRRLCSFSASQSERAVEVALETKAQGQRTYDMILQLHGKLSDMPPKEGTTS